MHFFLYLPKWMTSLKKEINYETKNYFVKGFKDYSAKS